jgi:small GTP-binding protein
MILNYNIFKIILVLKKINILFIKNMSCNNIIKRLKFNVIILGEAQVGKTSMISNLKGNKFEESGLSTTGIDFHNDEATFDGNKYKFKIFDTAGQERYRSISSQQIKVADGFMVVYAVNLPNSFEQIRWWVDTIEEETDITKKPVMLVANKVDVNDRKITHDEGYEYACSRKIKYIETSAKTGYNIKEAFNELYKDIYNIGKDDIKLTEENIKIRQSIYRRNKKKKC